MTEESARSRAAGDGALDTERLASKARRGHAGARDDLVRRSYPMLLHAAATYLRGRFRGLRRGLDEDDLAQSAYHDALRALDRCEDRGKGSFRRWLLGILYNKLRRKLSSALAGRRDARRDVPLLEQGPAASSGQDPVRRVLKAEEREQLLRALEVLAPKSREVLRMRYFEALPWKAVSARLGLSEEAAQMLCNRALRRLHTEYEAGSS